MTEWVVMELLLVPGAFFFIWGLARMGCSPEYQRYKDQHPGRYL